MRYDPYLVVGCRQGTATFSDIANGIRCAELRIWLGDALCFRRLRPVTNHKKMGIRKGCLGVRAQAAFRETGPQCAGRPVPVQSVLAIGGDVFARLHASPQPEAGSGFNHQHIFIDPSGSQGQLQRGSRLFDCLARLDVMSERFLQAVDCSQRASKQITLTNSAEAV